jgi:transposase
LEQTRFVARDLCWPCRLQRSADGHDDRQHGGEGTPFVRRRTQVAGKKGDQEQAIGRSRGGRTTKIHAIVDDAGRPHALLLTGGNVADITGASQLLAATEPSEELIADKAYDADHLRAFLQARGTLVVIPNKSNRVNLYPFDADKYKARNVIERSIGRIKDFRAIATRYDKTARNFLSGICLAAVIIWWIN